MPDPENAAHRAGGRTKGGPGQRVGGLISGPRKRSTPSELPKKWGPEELRIALMRKWVAKLSFPEYLTGFVVPSFFLFPVKASA